MPIFTLQQKIEATHEMIRHKDVLIDLGVLNEIQYLECFSKHTELMRQGIVVTEREGRLIRMVIKK
jgi:hypothetical protein